MGLLTNYIENKVKIFNKVTDIPTTSNKNGVYFVSKTETHTGIYIVSTNIITGIKKVYKIYDSKEIAESLTGLQSNINKIDEDLKAETTSRIDADEELQVQISGATGGLLGTLEYNAEAPTPAKNGYYDFVSAGAAQPWLNETVSIGDRVYVSYTAPTHAYSYAPVTDKFPIKDQSVFNVSVQLPLTQGEFYTAGTARAAVPEAIKKNGLVITYALGFSDWVTEKFIGATHTEFWENDISWEKQFNQNEILSINGYMNITTLSNSIRSTLIGIMNAVTDIYIEGNINTSAKYCISSISNLENGANVSIFEVVGATKTRVCEFYLAASSYRTGFETIELSEYENSGISGIAKVDWYMMQGSSYTNLYDDTHYLNRKAFNTNLFIDIDKTNADIAETNLAVIAAKGYIAETELKISKELSLMKANDSSIIDIELSNDGYIVAATGEINSNSNEYGYSEKMAILPGKTILLDNFGGSSNAFKIQYFDANNAKLSGVASNESHIVSIVPDDARYVRFCNERATSADAVIRIIGLNIDNALVGLYSPITQSKYEHALTENRNLGWRFTAYRSKIYDKDIITNVIKVPIWVVSDLSIFTERKLLLCDSVSTTNPSLMTDISDNIKEIILSNRTNEPTVIILKTPIRIAIGKIVVFAWESYEIFYGNINAEGSDVDNKLPFMFSTGVDKWSTDWSLASGATNTTPAFEFVLDENYKPETKESRTTTILATTSDFDLVDNASIVDSKPQITASTGWTKNMEYLIDTHIEKFRLSVAFKILTLTTGGYVSIGKYSVPNFGAAEVRLFANKIELHIVGGDYEGKIYEIALTEIAMASGNDIMLSIEKNTESVTIKVFDGSIYQSKNISKSTTSENIPNTELFAMMWGKPYIASYKVSFIVKDISFSSPYSPNVSKLSVWGDSFIEGSSLVPTGLADRYVAKLSAGIENFVPIFGKGGERLSKEWFDNFVIENDWFKTKYVLIALGTNNTDYDEYINTLKATIYHLEKNNQIPVLVTVTPRLDPNDHDVILNKTFKDAANSFIRSSRHLYVDMNKAVTTNSSGDFWVEEYVFGDGVHPTIEGHNRMYKRIDLDVPELFNI